MWTRQAIDRWLPESNSGNGALGIEGAITNGAAVGILAIRIAVRMDVALDVDRDCAADQNGQTGHRHVFLDDDADFVQAVRPEDAKVRCRRIDFACEPHHLIPRRQGHSTEVRDGTDVLFNLDRHRRRRPCAGADSLGCEVQAVRIDRRHISEEAQTFDHVNRTVVLCVRGGVLCVDRVANGRDIGIVRDGDAVEIHTAVAFGDVDLAKLDRVDRVADDVDCHVLGRIERPATGDLVGQKTDSSCGCDNVIDDDHALFAVCGNKGAIDEHTVTAGDHLVLDPRDPFDIGTGEVVGQIPCAGRGLATILQQLVFRIGQLDLAAGRNFAAFDRHFHKEVARVVTCRKEFWRVGRRTLGIHVLRTAQRQLALAVFDHLFDGQRQLTPRAGLDQTVVDDDRAGVGQTLARTGRVVVATGQAVDAVGHGAGPVCPLGHPDHRSKAQLVGVEVDVQVAFDHGQIGRGCMGIDLDGVADQIDRLRLQIVDRNGRAGDVVDAGFEAAVLDGQIAVGPCRQEHIAVRQNVGPRLDTDCIVGLDIDIGAAQSDGRGTIGFRIGLDIDIGLAGCLEFQLAAGLDIGAIADDDIRGDRHRDAALTLVERDIGTRTRKRTSRLQADLVGIVDLVERLGQQIALGICGVDIGVVVERDGRAHLGTGIALGPRAGCQTAGRGLDVVTTGVTDQLVGRLDVHLARFDLREGAELDIDIREDGVRRDRAGTRDGAVGLGLHLCIDL